MAARSVQQKTRRWQSPLISWTLLLAGIVLAMYFLYAPVLDQSIITRSLTTSSASHIGEEDSILPRTIVARGLDYIYSPPTNNSVHARATDDHRCTASQPCLNGACCGAGGYCGYGPSYCGSGCQSNCNATAECGQYAATPGTTCPMNVCCSQYGFCGTSSDFCTNNCQSNCVLHPAPVAPAASGSIASNRVIGYYESWSNSKKCHQVAPQNLPLMALTHVNFAFAYVDPSSFQIVPMDGQTPSSLFKDTTNLKSLKPGLKVWISVGGWTFSDNGTATQPVLGQIAADAGNRQKFSNNVVSFMQQYGFDGLDLDWEYPGAPDRGGKAQDTANYVLLMQTLRSTFSASGGNFGLSFTAPSSYWYLRWFDLPGLLKYVDFINVMTYDLHGVWDRNNPIGAIAQAHTNLTEIQSAFELFWRVKIPASKLNLGIGFYGRSFTLVNSSCTTPGCTFSGASNPGPCSNMGGVLAYYEIMAIQQQYKINPTWDKAAAVKYFTFATDQWVSYDDTDTFKQKIAWANTAGIGGSLIWASDLDDDKYSAHSAFTGKSIQSNDVVKARMEQYAPLALVADISASNGQDCFAYTGKCVNLNDKAAMQAACGKGNTVIGWDDAGCGGTRCHCGKPICCPARSAPSGCSWRGDNTGSGGFRTDCSGQCNPGEVNIKGIASSWGGGFTNDGDTNKCGRGRKVFCCPNAIEKSVVQKCGYTQCGQSCRSGYTRLFTKKDDCWFTRTKSYCCPQSTTTLTDCHWVAGDSAIPMDCANARCNATEVEVDKDWYGDGSNGGGCSWGRTQSACCSLVSKPVPPSRCSVNLCTKLPGFCPNDNDDESANGWRGSKRDLQDEVPSAQTTVHNFWNHTLAKRDLTSYQTVLLSGAVVITTAANYPPIGRLYAAGRDAIVLLKKFILIPGFCIGTSVSVQDIVLTVPNVLQGLQAEHPIDRQIIAEFVGAAANGYLRNRPTLQLPAVGEGFFLQFWNARNPNIAALPPIGGPNGAQPDTPAGRIMEWFGSYDYPNPFMATDSQINGAKGRIMKLDAATSIDTITRLANAAIKADTAAALDELLQAIRIGFAVFDYVNTAEGLSRWQTVRFNVDQEFGRLDRVFGYQFRLQDWWRVFSVDYFNVVELRAQSWADQAITAAIAPYFQAADNKIVLATASMAIATLTDWLENKISTMTLPNSQTVLQGVQ